ncbi:MAG: WYL domain-containing protein [Planctomycetota bacterium]|nr:WYL domain-containing protein [Planctomycetota bacterium]
MTAGDPKVLKLERQLNLVSYLLSSRKPVPFSDIRGCVVGYDDDASPDAVEKRFDRDKADLRSIGVNIEYIASDPFGRAGYVIDPRGYFLRETKLEPEDAMLLAVLQRTLGVVDDNLGRNLKSALAKLTIDSQLPEPLRASVGEQHLLTLGRPDNDPGRRHVAMLGEAVGRRRRVSFRYHTVDANRTETRTVRPYGLGLSQGNWYLVGFDETRKPKGAVRQFRLDRVVNKVSVIDKKDDAYDVPDEFDIARFIEQEEFEIGEGTEVEVRIELDDVATWLLARRRRGAGTLEERPDGTGLFRVVIRSEEGLFRWLSEFGQRARIVEPKRLAVAFRERMSATRALYDDVPVSA